jgi:hypothetical protein
LAPSRLCECHEAPSKVEVEAKLGEFDAKLAVLESERIELERAARHAAVDAELADRHAAVDAEFAGTS